MFIVLGARGWRLWAQHAEDVEVPIVTAQPRTVMLSIVASFVLSVCIAIVLWLARGSIPVFDGLITGTSLVAQWLLNRKMVQTWYWWIAVDVISIPVYIYKDLYLIAALYAVFLGICIAGLKSWKTEMQVEHEHIEPGPAGSAA
jgi:nicotinamide mononucleotide transporter